MNWNELKVGADTGAVGGMFTGLKEGADLGQLFANTGSINQQTMAREQKLPWELAQTAADVDTKVMANDATRAIQTPEYLDQTGKNALGEVQNKGLSIEQIKQEFPLDKFISMTRKQTLTNLSIMKQIRGGIQNGNVEQVAGMLYQMAPDEKSKALIKTEVGKAKANPQAALAALDDAEKQMHGLLQIDPQSALKMYEMFLEHQAKMLAAKNSGGRTAQPNWQLQRAQQVAAALKQNPAYSKLSNEQLLALAWKQIASQEKTQQIGDVTLGNNQTSGIEAYPEQGTTVPQGRSAPIKLK